MTTPVAVVIQYSVPLSKKMFTKTPISWPTRAMKRKLPQLVRSAFVVYPHSRQRAEHPRRDEQRREDRLRGERGEDERQRQPVQRRVGDEDEGRLDQVHVADERHEGADEQELDDQRDEDDRAAVPFEQRVQRGLAAADQVGDEAGETDGVDRRVAREERRRRLRGPGGRIPLRLGMELDDLRPRQVPGGLGGEAHHQDSADREVRRDEERHPAVAREPVQPLRVPPGCADDARYPRLEGGAHVPLDHLGRREIDHRLRSLEIVAELVTGLLERGSEDAADLPATAVQDDLHAAARATRAGLRRSTASWNRSSLGPTPAADRRSGASKRPASSETASGSTASISAMIRSNERSSVSPMGDLPSRP